MALCTWIGALWLIRRDVNRRPGLSKAIWIPTLWAAILLSRLPSAWLGFGGGSDESEGSPLNRFFFLGLTLLALAVLSKRRILWSRTIARNWPIFLLYGYFLISVTWAYDPFVSFKRWFKDLGNVFVVLVILTERQPLEAIKAVFIRSAYIWFPLSIVLIRWFPDWGRFYSRFGQAEIRGVTEQKNTLGLLVLVSGLVLFWEWFERSAPHPPKGTRLDRLLPPLYLAMGFYILYQCDSKTSLICLAVGGAVILTPRLRVLRKQIRFLYLYVLLGAGIAFSADRLFGLKDATIEALGRNPNLTGRTEIWAALLSYHTDPIFGTGFLSFWSDPAYASQFPIWMPHSAHNGYLETYLDGGAVAVALLVLMLFAVARRVCCDLALKRTSAVFPFAVLLAIIIGSYSESHFFRMSPLTLLFLTVTLSPAFIRSGPFRLQSNAPASFHTNEYPAQA